MKLEYIADRSPGGPLIRLYDFTTEEARQLLDIVAELACERAERVDVHLLPFVQALGGCRLTWIRRSWDQAIVQAGPSNFECGFTAGSWDNVAGLIEPLCEDLSRYQWLASSPGEAELLLSASGTW